MTRPLCTLVVCGAPLAVRSVEVAKALANADWRVRVLTTPAAAEWVNSDELASVSVTPEEYRPRERPAAVVIAPVTFNTVAKLATGIADTPAHSSLCEALGDRVPILALPTVNDRLWDHPAWAAHCSLLTAHGVKWLNAADGSVGQPAAVKSGTGGALLDGFDPAWVVAALSQLTPR